MDQRRPAASFAFDAEAFDLEAWLRRLATDEPCFIYERASTRTRAPVRSFIGFGHAAAGPFADGADPFGGLRAAIAAAASSPDGPQAVLAFLSYEALTGSELGTDTPRQVFLRPDILVDLDHETGTASVTGDGAARDAVRRSLSSAGPPPSAAGATPEDDGDGAVPAWTQAPTQAEFTARVLALKREIAGGGTVMGAALSVELSGALDVAPLRAYRALRRINPSTCMFFVRDGAFALWGATSLPVLRTDGRQIIAETDGATRRVAPGGTAPWVPDSKEVAEYDLVVSALREDLAGIIEDGSLHFIADREARQYFNLQHLFAEVEGTLARGIDAVEALRRLTPHGAATGYAKPGAIALIRRYDVSPRGPYAGAVGIFGVDGSADAACVIRSAWKQGPLVRTRAGAKIVAGSDPASEYHESVLKTLPLRQSIAGAMRA